MTFMYAWHAIYMIKDKETGLVKRVEYYVAAPTAGDVPETIRGEVNLEGSEVLDVRISRVRDPKVLSERHCS